MADLGESFDDEDKRQLHVDRPYDESLEIADSEDVASQFEPTPRIFDKNKFALDKKLDLDKELNGDDEEENVSKIPFSSDRRKDEYDEDDDDDDDDDDEDDDEDEDEDEDEDDDDNHKKLLHSYNPSDYENLPVSQEVKELFQHITGFTPQNIELDLELKPFIPDFIPAVGDIDAFLKIPRPDNKEDTLGLTVLDEPCVKQSDPNVLDLMLRSLSTSNNTNQSNNKIQVKSIDSTQEDCHKHITSWIKNIDKLHRSKPSPSVHYTKKMPEINDLMQEWQEPIENILKEENISFDFDCDLNSMVDIVCAMCDIPVYTNKIQSLHLLFSLYSEFRNSQHFQRKRRH